MTWLALLFGHKNINMNSQIDHRRPVSTNRGVRTRIIHVPDLREEHQVVSIAQLNEIKNAALACFSWSHSKRKHILLHTHRVMTAWGSGYIRVPFAHPSPRDGRRRSSPREGGRYPAPLDAEGQRESESRREVILKPNCNFKICF